MAGRQRRVIESPSAPSGPGREGPRRPRHTHATRSATIARPCSVRRSMVTPSFSRVAGPVQCRVLPAGALPPWNGCMCRAVSIRCADSTRTHGGAEVGQRASDGRPGPLPQVRSSHLQAARATGTSPADAAGPLVRRRGRDGQPVVAYLDGVARRAAAPAGGSRTRRPEIRASRPGQPTAAVAPRPTSAQKAAVGKLRAAGDVGGCRRSARTASLWSIAGAQHLVLGLGQQEIPDDLPGAGPCRPR